MLRARAATPERFARNRLQSHVRARIHSRTCYLSSMRTTIEFDADTAKAVQRLRREQGLGVSEAVNELIRRGMLRPEPRRPFRQKTYRLGIMIDVANVADALEVLEGTQHR